MEASPGMFPPRLLPLGGVTLLVLCRPSLHVALHVGVGHQVDVTVRVALETNQHHTWQDGKHGQFMTSSSDKDDTSSGGPSWNHPEKVWDHLSAFTIWTDHRYQHTYTQNIHRKSSAPTLR